jgi:hypothetical protein
MLPAWPLIISRRLQHTDGDDAACDGLADFTEALAHRTLHAWPVLCRSRVAHAGRLAWAAANQVIFKAMESKNLLSQTNMLLSKEVELADMPFQLMRTASITLTSSPLPLPSASSSIVS